MTTKKIATKTAPKATKSVVIKKVVAKKVVTKKTVRKAVSKTTCCACSKSCEPTHAFWVNNGPIVYTIDDLLKALKEMSDDQFFYHTKRNGNDFVNWIKDCLHDAVCAQSLKNAQTRLGAIRSLSNRCKSC